MKERIKLSKKTETGREKDLAAKRSRPRRSVRILALIACILSLNLFSVWAASDASYITEGYDVDVAVSEDGVLSVTETMNLDFYRQSHGIYRYIPYNGTITYEYGGDVRTERYLMDIKNVDVPGFESVKSYENGNVLIRIGSEDELVSGPVTYVLRYDAAVYEDRSPDLDQIYWGLIPTDTPTPTQEASFHIQMPKEFDPSKVAFIAGRYGEADGEAVDFYVEGNDIYGKTNRPLAAGEGVTLRIELPDGYFQGAASNAWMRPAMWFFICLAPLVTAALWLVFGRDRKVVQTVEFYPPEGISPAEVGFLLDDASDDRDVISLVLYFADKGYLEILEENAKVFRLIKKKELPADAKGYEKTMFEGLFRKGDSVLLSELSGEFYKTFRTVKGQLADEFNSGQGRAVYTKGSKIARIFSLLLMVNPLFAMAILGLGYQYRSMLLALVSIPLALLVFVGLFWFIWIYDKKDHLTRGSKAGGRIGAVAVTVVGLAGFLIFGIMTGLTLPAIAAVLAALICGFFAMLMKQRTPYSVQQMGKILGFKEFIRTAELPRLKLLSEETPHYFYHVLPYAYVFGLTNKWVKHFEGLAVPEPTWYRSTYNSDPFTTLYFLHSLNECTKSIHSNIAVPPVSDGGGYSGGGGGFSGGGFSGGGMGGGGMGSW